MELPACPVETTLMLIGDKWKVLILRDLMDGTKRFGELKKSIGHVSQKVLTAQLRNMEDKGLLTRKVYAEVPPRVEYTLTDIGYSLKPILDSMVVWGTDYQQKARCPPSLPQKQAPNHRFGACFLSVSPRRSRRPRRRRSRRYSARRCCRRPAAHSGSSRSWGTSR